MYSENDVDRSILRANVLKQKLNPYLKYFKIIEEYAIKMDLNACEYTAYALSAYDTKDIEVMQFYCKGAYKHAEILANLLYNAGAIYASAHAITPNKEWIVQINLETVVRLRELSFSIMYTEIKSIYNGEQLVKCNQINQQLIFIYGNMMNPAYKNDFESLHHQEIVLCAMYKSFLKSKSILKNVEFIKMSGGRTRAQIIKHVVNFEDKDDKVGEGPKSSEIIEDTVKIIIQNIKKHKCIVTGVHAMDLYTRKTFGYINGMPIKVIYDKPMSLLHDINLDLESIGITLSTKTSNPSIPKYERMFRTKLILEVGNRVLDVVEIFNNTSFSLIPYVPINEFCCISVYGILFFKLIDLWIIKLVEAIKISQNKKINMSNVYRIEEEQLEIYFTYYDMCVTAKKFEYLYPPTYMGTDYPLREYEKALSHNNIFKGPTNYLANGKIHF